MPHSMTGFGSAVGDCAAGTIEVEVRSVNHRFFHFTARLPFELSGWESEVKDVARKAFERGHVAVSIRWTSTSYPSGKSRTVLDPIRAREAMANLRELQAAVGLSGEIPLELVADQARVFIEGTDPVVPVAWSELEPIVTAAVRHCRDAREREGEVLKRDVQKGVERLFSLAAEVAGLAPGRLIAERDRLRSAVVELIGNNSVDENRIALEIAILADRLDIHEELTRTDLHLHEMNRVLESDGPVGKKLGFLAQELGREVNTIGAKAADTSIQHAVVEMKTAMEKIREQLENLE